MFCKNCSRQIEDDSDICPYCGVRQFDGINNNNEYSNLERNIIDKKTIDNIKIEASDRVKDLYDKAVEPSLKKIEKETQKKVKKIVSDITDDVLIKVGIKKPTLIDKALKKIKTIFK